MPTELQIGDYVAYRDHLCEGRIYRVSNEDIYIKIEKHHMEHSVGRITFDHHSCWSKVAPREVTNKEELREFINNY